MKTEKNYKIKLAALFVALLCVALALSACYPDFDGDGYRTTPLGTGTEAIVLPENTTVAPDITNAPPIPENTTGEQNPDGTLAPSDTTTSTPSSETTTKPEDTAPPVEPDDFVFEIVTKSSAIGSSGANKSERVLRYPRLTSLANAEDQEDINKLFSDIAEAEFRTRLPNADEMISSGLTLRYEITSTEITYMGNNILSVRSEGFIDCSDDTQDEKFVYCNNINLSTQKDITLKKTYSDFESVLTLFKSGEFAQILGETQYNTTQALTAIAEQYKYHAQYGTFPESYFKKSSLIIVIEVDREGGYFAEFEIDINKVSAFLNIGPSA